tara:strand:- start:566 stop:982 length:417 start_codon:yes stop_codon:yes gene_type:complete
MNVINYQIGESYQVIEPNLHDSNLISVEHDKNDTLIKFRSTSGELIQAVASNVKKLIINDFREGNIVLDVTIERMVKIPDYGLDKLLLLSKVKCEKQDAYIRTVKDKIESGEMMLVTINPSYGCNGMIYCEKISFCKV